MISLLQTADAVVVAEQTRMGLWQLFMSGGWLMWVLLILGGLTIFIFVERFMAIRKASEFDMNFMNRIRDYILDGKVVCCGRSLPQDQYADRPYDRKGYRPDRSSDE